MRMKGLDILIGDHREVLSSLGHDAKKVRGSRVKGCAVLRPGPHCRVVSLLVCHRAKEIAEEGHVSAVGVEYDYLLKAVSCDLIAKLFKSFEKKLGAQCDATAHSL